MDPSIAVTTVVIRGRVMALALFVALLGSACGSDPEPSQVFRWLPDDAAPPAPVTQRVPLPLCGVVHDEAPTPAAILRCALAAYQAGGSAEFVVDLRVDGTRLVQILRVLPGRRVETIDGTLPRVPGFSWPMRQQGGTKD